ncbi:transposase [Anaerosolibacter sp.]|uniref:transposase n=1 Tax=Anaerosolibacter sp. TaxID=1872527 RepID=UPI0039F0B09A
MKSKYPKRTIEEKNKIVEEYLEGSISRTKLLEKYQIANDSMLSRWVEQYRRMGTTYDNRGKGGTGRPKKTGSLNPEEMTREELIQYVKAVEDLKKFMAYQKRLKKNTD